MQTKEKLRQYMPHIAAIVLFIVVSFAYFYPVLEGKILKANDSTVSRINSKEIHDFREDYGSEPLWTNSVFSGMPAFLISTLYPGNLIKYADRVLRIFKMPVSVLFVSMLGFYLMLLIFGVNPWLAITGALAWGFSSFFFQILAAGHNTQAIALAYMPPFIGGVYYAYRKNAVAGALITAFALALQISANHPQITYYSLLCLLVFGIFEFSSSLRNKTIPDFLKSSLILLIPFMLSVGINFASLYTTWEYGKYSIRGKSDLTHDNKAITDGLDKDYILSWSYGVGESFNLLIPNFKGGSSKPLPRDSETVKVLTRNGNQAAAVQFQKYWGSQPGTDGPHYMGAIVIFLFVLGLVLIRGPEKWWLLVATVLSLMLAWGKNFMPLSDLFIDYFPGYNKFRAVTMILVIAGFCIPLLGILALRDIFNGTAGKKEVLKGLKIAGGVTGGFLLLVIVFPSIAGSFISYYEAEANLPAWLTAALVTDRKALLTSDAFRSLVFIILGAGTILAFILGKMKQLPAILILTLLIFTDLWSAGKRYLDADRFVKEQRAFVPSAADATILADKSYYRVINWNGMTFNDNTPTSYFHKSIGGYHGAKLQRYQELIDTSLSRNFDLIEAVAANARSAEEFQSVFSSTNALNMLNAKYLIYNPEAPPLVNPHALGNAWFVGNVILVKDANEEISHINTFNPANEAIVDDDFSSFLTRPGYPVNGDEKIELASYKANELVYRYSAKEEKLAVFSEIYYPEGWRCYINGKESSHFRANYVLRAMVLPAGDNEVRFEFHPSSYYTGNRVSLASSILLLLLTAGYFSRGFLKRSKA